MKKMLNKNKKAGISETITDFFSTIFIIAILIGLFLISNIFSANKTIIKEEEFQERILEDKFNFLFSSLLREKQDNELEFVDLIRIKNEKAITRLKNELYAICKESDRECDVEIYEKNINCKMGLDKEKDTFCFFIPGEEKITIKIYYYYTPDIGTPGWA